MTDVNKATVLGFIEAMGSCDAEAAAPFLAADATYRVMKYPFDFQQDREAFLKTIAATGQMVPGGIKPVIRNMLVDGDQIVAEAMGHGTMVDGRPYENAYCWFFKLENGKIKAFWQYLCTEYATSALSPAAKK